MSRRAVAALIAAALLLSLALVYAAVRWGNDLAPDDPGQRRIIFHRPPGGWQTTASPATTSTP